MKVLKFSAGWCKPCESLKKVISETDLGDVEFQDIDVDTDMASVSKYGVRGFPTLVMVDDNGVELKRAVGMMSGAELKDWVSL